MAGSGSRLKKVMAFIAALFLALTLRIGWIQTAGHDDLAAAVRSQSLISLEGGNTRGVLYDYSGKPLVADQLRFVYIIRKNQFDYQVGKVMKRLGASQVHGENEGYYVYSSEHYDKKLGKWLITEHQAYVLQASARYGSRQTAANLIGYINDQDASGACGLELMMDDELSLLNRHMYAAADVKGNLIPGRGLILAKDRQTSASAAKDNGAAASGGVRTTLDKELQSSVEDILNQENRNCAVVVLRADDGGIAAMACTPTFDPNQIGKYLESGKDELVNKATQGAYAPGSVFKIVVAAAALESGVSAGQQFECRGSVSVGNLNIKCETGGETGHGIINMEEAFAHSCNSYFVQLGQKIGSDAIIETAQKFQLGKAVFEGYPQESRGHLMSREEWQGAAIGNLSIGQGETLVTPIQVARMTGIIASSGADHEISVRARHRDDSHQVISADTANQIRRMMERVTTEGTGAGLSMIDRNGSPKAAVKTGTVEYQDGGEVKTHAWITGYTPCREPEYIITVFVENGDSGSSSAGPIFRKIIEYLEKSGSYSAPTLA